MSCVFKVHDPPFRAWPLLLKIEHMVKLQVLGNNSKTVNNIKNLTGVNENTLCSLAAMLDFKSAPKTQ
jgi:hypothetical protein